MGDKTLRRSSDESARERWRESSRGCSFLKFKTFKEEIKRLAKGNSYSFNTLSFLLVVNIIVAAIGFATRIKMANELGSIEFGLLSYSIAISAYIETIVRYGTDKTLVRDIVYNKDKIYEILASSIFLKIILFSICLLAVYFYSKTTYNDIILWVIIGGSIVSFEAKGAYDATNNIRRHSIYYIFYRILYYILLWIPIYVMSDIFTVKYIGIAMAISGFVYIIIQYFWIFDRYTFVKTEPMAIYRCTANIFFENLPICLAALCGLGLIAFNQLILKEYCGTKELGIYAVAWQFFWVGNLFVVQLSRVGQPILAEKIFASKTGNNEVPLFILKYIAVMLVTILPISLPMILFPEFIIGTFFSQEYIQSIAPLRIIGLYMIVISVDMVVTQYLIIQKKNRLYMMVMSVFGVTSMLLSLVIIPKYQATGAAISLFVSHAIAISVLGYFVVQSVMNEHEHTNQKIGNT